MHLLPNTTQHTTYIYLYLYVFTKVPKQNIKPWDSDPEILLLVFLPLKESQHYKLPYMAYILYVYSRRIQMDPFWILDKYKKTHVQGEGLNAGPV